MKVLQGKKLIPLFKNSSLECVCVALWISNIYRVNFKRHKTKISLLAITK